MDTSSKERKPRLCIALPDTPRNLYIEIGRMLIDALKDSEYDVSIVQDGDKTGLYADRLIMMGDCQAFLRYPRMLKDRLDQKPHTTLWLLDTLPPKSLSRSAARIGGRLSIYNKALLLLRSQLRPAASAIPLEVRRRIGEAACSKLLTGLNESQNDELSKLDTTSQYEVLGRYEWIRKGVDEGWLDNIFVNTMPKKEFLDVVGIPSEFIPLGYHADMGVEMNVARDIDVLCIGELAYGRRKPIVEFIQEQLAPRGIKVTVVSGSCYGEQRSELLSRSKVCLNIPRFSWDLPTIRIFMSMGCGSMVVSEDIGDSSPFVSGTHFAQASVEGLPDLIADYVANDDKRLAVTQAAKELIHGDLTLRNVVCKVVGVPSKAQSIGDHLLSA